MEHTYSISLWKSCALHSSRHTPCAVISSLVYGTRSVPTTMFQINAECAFGIQRVLICDWIKPQRGERCIAASYFTLHRVSEERKVIRRTEYHTKLTPAECHKGIHSVDLWVERSETQHLDLACMWSNIAFITVVSI